MEVHLTHIGGPTVLIEVGGWRLLTDPTFDPPGRSYRFGWGTGSRKLTGPAIAASDLGPIDAVLLSHDHHDDNLDAAESTAAFLRLEGHEVKTVGDGNEALASVRVFAPHVIVLDIGLPGLDGYAVAQQLRERGDTSHTLLVAMTGYGQREDRERAMAAGFDYHFVKPTDPRLIQRAIEQGRKTPDAAAETSAPQQSR